MRRQVLAAVAMWMLALTVSAQEPVITVVAEIPVSQRQGTYTSTSHQVPADADGFARVIAVMDDAAYLNTANSCWIRILEQRDGVWVELAGVRWTGGAQNDPELGANPRPFADIPLSHFRGRLLRAELEVPTRMRIGAMLETSPVPFW